ncbi:HAD-IA family hydrolase [Breoghania sp. L-A4]|uniref:HAD-IA family hydrolase n=1 Tax=Breoghania sp. L-A4 TaxID=2304600 RepID=UPI000E358A93|nr:HAD-IA family hydrolase [Breoghania sp. L-A4]AXS41967.1 HAD family hydrolase [Breoghania sp. L-A4]
MARALIFDVDGTLAETEEAHRAAFNAAFEDAGLAWHWDRAQYEALLKVTGGKERIRHFVRSTGGDPRHAENAFIRALHAEKTRHYTGIVAGGGLELRPGVRELIDHARKTGLRLAISTTTTLANVEALLGAAFGGMDLFEVIVAGDMVAQKKPAPDAYLETLRRLDLAPAECLALEDSANGLRAALAAGLDTLVTPSVYTAGEDFSGARAVLPDLGALQAVGWDVDHPSLQSASHRV